MAERLKGLPQKARPLRGRGALPKPENLQKKSPEELVRTLNRFGLEPDLEAMQKRARRAFERLDGALAGGLEPDPALWDTIDRSIEREVTGYIRQQVKSAIRNYRNHRIATVANIFVWVTVGDERVCDSCEPRHGKSKSMKVWQRIGLPGSPNLVCGSECRCSLQPDPKAADEIR